MKSWKGLLLAIDLLKTGAEATFRVGSEDGFHTGCWNVNWLITVLLSTSITQMIFFNQGMLLPGSNHFLTYNTLL